MSDPELLDLSGLRCPLVAIATKRRLLELKAGQLLTVITTDPMALIDLTHMAHENGFRVENSVATASGNWITFRAGSEADGLEGWPFLDGAL